MTNEKIKRTPGRKEKKQGTRRKNWIVGWKPIKDMGEKVIDVGEVAGPVTAAGGLIGLGCEKGGARKRRPEKTPQRHGPEKRTSEKANWTAARERPKKKGVLSLTKP